MTAPYQLDVGVTVLAVCNHCDWRGMASDRPTAAAQADRHCADAHPTIRGRVLGNASRRARWQR
jgi:hypothetical protein